MADIIKVEHPVSYTHLDVYKRQALPVEEIIKLALRSMAGRR